jgi:hypothetical protein
MTLEEVETSIKSLGGFEGRIGLMGGEPTLHPKFSEICKLYQKLVPERRKRELWTDGFKWEEYKDAINETFDEDLVHYNDHSKPEEGWHQPVLISIDEVVADKEKMWRLINNCWVQRRWSASITPKGAFFCEIAAAIDHAFDGPGGWKLEPGWVEKSQKEFRTQQEFCCIKCSAAIPMADIPNNHDNVDLFSTENYIRLRDFGSPKIKDGRAQIVDQEGIVEYLNSSELKEGERGYWKSHPEWRPSEFRTKVWHGPGEGSLSPKEVRFLQKDAKNMNSKRDRVAEIRSTDLTFTEKSITLIKGEVSDEVYDFISINLKGIPFEDEASLIQCITHSIGSVITNRETDLILKYASDPLLRSF